MGLDPRMATGVPTRDTPDLSSGPIAWVREEPRVHEWGCTCACMRTPGCTRGAYIRVCLYLMQIRAGRANIYTRTRPSVCSHVHLYGHAWTPVGACLPLHERVPRSGILGAFPCVLLHAPRYSPVRFPAGLALSMTPNNTKAE